MSLMSQLGNPHGPSKNDRFGTVGEGPLCGQNGPLTSNIEGRLSGKSIAIDHVG